MRNYIEHYLKDGDYFDYRLNNSKGRQEVERRRREAISYSLRPLKKEAYILDIGSGSGKLASRLAGDGFNSFAIDLSSINLSLINHEKGIFPVLADGFILPWKDGSFDAVIMSSILEHCEVPQQMLKEAMRVLRSGGIAVVVTPFNEKIIYHQCIHCNKLTPSFAHLHSFDGEKLHGLLDESGLKVNSQIRFCNIGLDIAHINILLKPMHYHLWRLFDIIANWVLPRPEFILLTARK